MKSEQASQLDTFLKSLPRSEMVYPKAFHDQLKYIFWRLYTPYHPLVRDIAVAFGVVKHSGRQDYFLGNVPANQSIEEFISFLIAQGFKSHFVALKDADELVSLRYVDNFVYQYHLRIFKDGEVRGHYEYTPECRPILHYRKIGQRDCRSELLALMGDKVILD